MEKINTDSISDRVYKSIKNLIISKKIIEKINQEDLAKNLGVSRTPVMYALNRLHAEGFLEMTPYKGFFIKKYDSEEFNEIIEARLVFELYGIEKLIKNITAKDIEILKNYIKKFNNYFKNNDVAKYRNLDIDFHNYIIEKINNRHIIDI